MTNQRGSLARRAIAVLLGALLLPLALVLDGACVILSVACILVVAIAAGCGATWASRLVDVWTQNIGVPLTVTRPYSGSEFVQASRAAHIPAFVWGPIYLLTRFHFLLGYIHSRTLSARRPDIIAAVRQWAFPFFANVVGWGRGYQS